jgi:hypothetical protein
MSIIKAVVFVGLLGAGGGQAQVPVGEYAPQSYVAYRALDSLDIDGRLDEPSWQRAEWTDLFVDIEGEAKPLPRFKTRAKMLWDDTYLYIAADMEEPHVWATLKARDSVIFRDNDFEVFIDPDGDTQAYYEFEINAFGTEWDLLLIKAYRDGGPAINAWDIAGLKTAVQVWGTINQPEDLDQGWSVEMAFPWQVLKEAARRPAPPHDGDQWRINFSRVEWEVETDDGYYTKVEGKREDNWVWSPQGLINMHVPERWGLVQFATAPVGTETVDFRPDPAEEARQLLRQIYYLQRQFKGEHKRYSSDLDSLGLEHRMLRHYLWPPVLEAGPRQFEASLEEVVDTDGDGKVSRWFIREDSRVWKE